MSEPTARPELDVCECSWFRQDHPSKPIQRAADWCSRYQPCVKFTFLRVATPAEIEHQDRVAEWERANP